MSSLPSFKQENLNKLKSCDGSITGQTNTLKYGETEYSERYSNWYLLTYIRSC